MIDDLNPDRPSGMVDDLGGGNIDLGAQAGMTDDLAPPKAGGGMVDDLGEGEIRNSDATWGDVFSSIARVSPVGRAVNLVRAAAGNPDALRATPQERQAFMGTVVPGAIVGGSLLVGGPGAGLAAREAVGLTSGALSRAAIAKARGEDPVTAATGYDRETGDFHPGNIMLDAGLSALPEVWQGTKYVAGLAPEAVKAPIRAAAGVVRDRGAAALSNLADKIAQRYPRYAAQLLDRSELPPSLRSVISDRPDVPWDEAWLATEPLEGAGNAAGTSKLGVLGETMWKHASRDLVTSDDPVVRAAGLMVRKAGRLDRSFEQVAQQRLQSVLGGVNASQSSDVVDALERGVSPFTTAPDVAAQARPVRELLHEVGDLRKTYVMDDVTKAHGLDVLDANELPPFDSTPVQTVGDSRQYRSARDLDFFYPHKAATPEDTGLLQTPLERIIERNPGLSSAAARRRLHQLRTSNTTGWSRTFDDLDEAASNFEYTKDLHDAVPRYVNSAGRTIANGAVFGTKPVKIVIGRGGSTIELTVGDKAAAALKHMDDTRQHEAARLFENALLERYAPGALSTGDPRMADLLRYATRKTSDMALSHSFLTQLGQAPTAAWAAGGTHQIARGLSMVEHNPELRALFAAGPQKTELVDFLQEARGETGQALNTPMRLMHGIENWLRGPASYASVAMLDDISQEAAAVKAAGGSYSKALIRRAAEAGTTPDALADEIIRNGKLSHGTWLDGIQSLTDRWQYTTGPGEVPNALRTPTGAALLQYRAFSVKAAQHFLDDIVGVLREGYRTGDQSLIDLGKQRLRGFALTSVPGNMGTSAIKSLARGRAPSLAAALKASVKGPTGVIGDAALLPVDLATMHYGDHPVENFGDIPLVSVPASAIEDMSRGIASGEPLLAAKGAATLGGIYSPNIPLYSAAPLGLANSLVK